LTDEKFFQGRLTFLNVVRAHASLPILRKDFIVDRYQIVEARVHGADAILLIVSALEQERLRDLLAFATSLKLDALVETHDEREVEIAQACDAEIVGINNRDLRTFKTDIATTMRLLPGIDASKIVVSSMCVVVSSTNTV